MQCSKCGAELLPSQQECARCAENAAPTAEPNASASDTPGRSSPKPIAQITPFSGPYPPDYVQASAYEIGPRPINIWAKWIGLAWCAGIPISMLVNANNVKADRVDFPDPITGGDLNLITWIGIWAIVAVPALLTFLITRRKPSRRRGF